jgi:hypothetical protein
MKWRVFFPAAMFFLIFAASGCKKVVTQAAENFMINLITNNIWLVESFSVAGSDITADFTPFEFKFNKNSTVFGQRPSLPDVEGTWSANPDAQTITSNFPTAPHPCNKLNGIWQIQKTTLSSVQANRFDGSIEYKLFLVKK